MPSYLENIHLGYDVEDFAGHSLRAFVISVLLPSILG